MSFTHPGTFAGVVIAAALLILPTASSGQSATDSDADLVKSCAYLPSDAATTVPPPFDNYMRLTCVQAGQALRPMEGYVWAFPQGTMWLIAAPPGTTRPPGSYYTHLSAATVTPDYVDALHKALHRMTDKPEVFAASIIKLDMDIAKGGQKHILLLIPPEASPPTVHVLGMECVSDNCEPIESDPWFFSIIPITELQKH